MGSFLERQSMERLVQSKRKAARAFPVLRLLYLLYGLLTHRSCGYLKKTRLLQAAESSTNHPREEAQPDQLLTYTFHNMQNSRNCHSP